MTCSVDGCDTKVIARGLCNKHYKRLMNHGNVSTVLTCPSEMPLFDRLDFYGWETTDSGCWEWSGYRQPTGYGLLRCGGRNWAVHRLSYERTAGQIPSGMLLRHKCDNPPCINPDHLTPGTHADNVRDRDERGRTAAYSPETFGKLNWSQVREMRRLYADGVPRKELSAQFGVTLSNIYHIVNNKSWRESNDE